MRLRVSVLRRCLLTILHAVEGVGSQKVFTFNFTCDRGGRFSKGVILIILHAIEGVGSQKVFTHNFAG